MTECFTCAQPSNYAAVALRMQQTALEAEACIFGLEQRLRGAVNQPTFVGAFSDVNIAANFFSLIPTGGAVLFQNSTIGQASVLPRGVYEAGMSFTMTAVGAVTANSYRLGHINVASIFAPLSSPPKFSAHQTSFEVNTGNGVDITFCTVLASDGNDRVFLYVQHGNVASNMNVTNGRYWITKLSDLDSPRVVV